MNNPLITIIIPRNNDTIPDIVKNDQSAIFPKRMQQIVKIKNPIPPKIILIDFILPLLQ
jgi:hypothetical protein